MMIILLHKLRRFLFKILNGKGIGEKFPILWKIYDFFFRLFSPKESFQEIQGSKMYINMREKEYWTRRILQDYSFLGTHEPETTKIIRKYLKEGDIFLDIGASYGYFSLLAAKLVGEKGKVYSFEPNQKNFWYLCENIKLNNYNNCFPFLAAAWEKDKLIQIFFSPEYSYWMNGIALDNFLPEKKIDFIKIDIDGGEVFALKGMEKIIKENKNLKMVIEYYPKYLERYGESADNLMNFLKKYFEVSVIHGDYGDGCWNLFCKRK